MVVHTDVRTVLNDKVLTDLLAIPMSTKAVPTYIISVAAQLSLTLNAVGNIFTKHLQHMVYASSIT